MSNGQRISQSLLGLQRRVLFNSSTLSRLPLCKHWSSRCSYSTNLWRKYNQSSHEPRPTSNPEVLELQLKVGELEYETRRNILFQAWVLFSLGPMGCMILVWHLDAEKNIKSATERIGKLEARPHGDLEVAINKGKRTNLKLDIEHIRAATGHGEVFGGWERHTVIMEGSRLREIRAVLNWLARKVLV